MKYRTFVQVYICYMIKVISFNEKLRKMLERVENLEIVNKDEARNVIDFINS